MTHKMVKCEKGHIIQQCRCPSRNKPVTIVPHAKVCPPDESTSVHGMVTDELRTEIAKRGTTEVATPTVEP